MEVTKTLGASERVNLSKDAQGADLHAKVELGWNAQEEINGQPFDPDACLMVVTEDGKVNVDTQLLFYNQNRKLENGHPIEENGKPVWNDPARPYPFILNDAIKSSGDNRTGAADSTTVGDAKETIKINFAALPANVLALVPFVTIYQAKERKQHFSNMTDAFVRVVDENNAFPAFKADLQEDYSTAEALIPGYFYKKDNQWRYLNEPIAISTETLGIGEAPNPINVGENIIKLAKIKLPEHV